MSEEYCTSNDEGFAEVRYCIMIDETFAEARNVRDVANPK